MSDTGQERSPEENPRSRATDQGFLGKVRYWWGPRNGYRDVWLVLICVAIYFAFEGDNDQDTALQASRLDATLRSCESSNTNTDGINEAFTAVQSIILAGAALPGDTPSPLGVKDPSEWDKIIPGPLSDQIASQFPDFPSSEERLKAARTSSDEIEEQKVEPRNCTKEVNDLRNEIEAQTGINLDATSVATPTPTPKKP